MPAKGTVVYLFTTASNSKPTYRRGILDLLTYPAGHVQQFSYRRSDIHPSTMEYLARGKRAVVVFVDIDSNAKATYMPLRWVGILETDPRLGDSQGYDAEERVKFFLEVGRYVEYRTSADFHQWHQHLKPIDAVREAKGGGGRYFVVPGPDVFSPPRAASPALSWENLVTAVSQSSRFSDAIFLRLDHLRSYRRERAEVGLIRYSHGPRSYLLRPGQDYQLDFDLFIKPHAASSQGIAPSLSLACSSEIIKTTKPFQSVVSGLVQQSAIISCKRTIERTRTALSLEIGEPAKGVVNTPNPVLLLDSNVSRWILWEFLVLVFLGGLLVSSDKDALEIISSSPALWVWMAKFAGSALLTAAAYLAFRRLPSGQG